MHFLDQNLKIKTGEQWIYCTLLHIVLSTWGRLERGGGDVNLCLMEPKSIKKIANTIACFFLGGGGQSCTRSLLSSPEESSW